MAVHVDEMVSEVTAEPEPRGGSSGEIVEWKEIESVREAQARVACDRWRTAAEGYDD